MKTKFQSRLEKVPEHTKLMVSKSFDITDRILNVLDAKGWSQKDLAIKLGKNESEISRWMKGTHNFTLETIAKVEIALGCTILNTSQKHEEGQLVANMSTVRNIYLDRFSGGAKAATFEEEYTSVYEFKKNISIEVSL